VHCSAPWAFFHFGFDPCSDAATYGAFEMGGDAFQMADTPLIGGFYRGIRGGSCYYGSTALQLPSDDLVSPSVAPAAAYGGMADDRLRVAEHVRQRRIASTAAQRSTSGTNATRLRASIGPQIVQGP